MPKLGFLAGALLVVATAPAAAQYQSQNRYYYGGDINTRIQRLEDRLQRGIESDRISGSEAAMIRRDLRTLRSLQRQYGRNGFSQWEQAELQRRIESLNSQLQYAMQNGDYRGRYDDNDDYGRYGDDDRWNDRDDRDDRWDDRNGGWNDRDDRWNNDDRGYDQGGYYGVPDRYGSQYRDTDRYYFRYRDGYIYQFDRNSDRVVNTIRVGR